MTSTHPIPLDALPLKQYARIVDLIAPIPQKFSGDSQDPQQDLLEQLASIGMIAGEQVCVLAAGKPGNDPLVVRIGTSTFALRRSEAALIQVLPANRSMQQELSHA